MPEARIRAMSLSIVRSATLSVDARSAPDRGAPRRRRNSSMSACWRSIRRNVRCGSVDWEYATPARILVICLSVSLSTVAA